jgi:hypothetical protein
MTITDRIARAICQETCAFMGEPACWRLTEWNGEDECPWPNPLCNNPGCQALAEAVLAEIKDELK